jgi:hypothetical protein
MSTGSVADDDGIAQVANDVGVSADTVNRIAAAESEVDGNDVSDGNLSIMDDYGVEPATDGVRHRAPGRRGHQRCEVARRPGGLVRG